MKTKPWIILFTVLLALCHGLRIPLLFPAQDAAFAEIVSDGQLLHTVALNVDREITISTYNGGRNVVTVRDGKIAVTEATCPDLYCMERGCCSGGTQIVCLPNRLVIAFVDDQEIDGVSG